MKIGNFRSDSYNFGSKCFGFVYMLGFFTKQQKDLMLPEKSHACHCICSQSPSREVMAFLLDKLQF